MEKWKKILHKSTKNNDKSTYGYDKNNKTITDTKTLINSEPSDVGTKLNLMV